MQRKLRHTKVTQLSHFSARVMAESLHHYESVKQQLGAGEKHISHKAKLCTWDKTEFREMR